jgi:FtsP/CotA-like multicopper oxidase with cupredoxin domain
VTDSVLEGRSKTPGRRDSTEAVLAVLIAVVVVGWQQLWHHTVLRTHGPEGSVVTHFLRDGALAIIPAFLAVRIGLRLARRRAGLDPTLNMLSTSGWIAGTFALVMVPMVALHSLVDNALGGDGGLGSIEPAPGTAYLTDPGGLESANGFWGLAAHGFRDAALGTPVAFAVAALGLVALSWRARPTQVPSTVASPQVSGALAALSTATLTKRELLKLTGAGAAAAAISSSGLVVLGAGRAHAAEPGESTPWLSDDIELFIRDGIYETIEGTPVFMYGWGFRSGGLDGRDEFLVPGPVLWANHGDTIDLTITNTRTAPHAFVIDGVIDTGPIAPGDTVSVSFAAPSPGTYMYEDSSNGSVNRVLGLHGVLVVMPADRTLRPHQDLPGEFWTFVTQWVWVFNEIDPRFNARAQAGIPIDAGEFAAEFLPRYFTLNGRMGSLAAHEETAPDTVISDTVGNPALVRIVNAGLAMHGPHFHGNHVYPLLHNAEVPRVIMWKDTIRVMPEERIDVLIPFAIPPNAVHFPPLPEGDAFLEELHGHPMEGKWPMHCHIEMSQTAAGGLYPQGLLTDWKMKP